MAAKKPAKPTRLQAKADKKGKILTGPKGSKPQSTTSARAAKPGPKAAVPNTTRAKPAAKPKPAPAKPSVPSGGRNLFGGAGSKATAIKDAGPRAPKPEFKTNRTPFSQAKPAAKPSGGRPALPPGRQGGALVRQGNAKPENPRRTSARSRQATASRGTTGPSRVGQPAGSANRMYGANVVNRSVNRAVTATRLAGLGKVAGRLAVPVALATETMNVVKGFKELANSPFIKKMGKGTPTGTRTGRTGRGGTTSDVGGNPAKDGRYIPGSQQVKFNQAKPKPKPKPSSGTTRASAPSRSSTPSRSSAPSRSTAPARTPSRSSAPARPAAASRPASRPAASSAPKAPVLPKVETTTTDAPKPPTTRASSVAEYNVSQEEGNRRLGKSAPATKKKGSALTQAQIRKRRLGL